MEFRNLTPFGALCFGALDPGGREHRVVVLRACYELRPRPQEPGWFDACVLDDDPPDLVLADRYTGEEGRSSLVCESDLAPYKPRCDVLVHGKAHAPEGRAAKSWSARVRLICPAREGETDAARSPPGGVGRPDAAQGDPARGGAAGSCSRRSRRRPSRWRTSARSAAPAW
jgi:hypothetical protein